MWESWGGKMDVKVKWFYHPEETKSGKKLSWLKVSILFQLLLFFQSAIFITITYGKMDIIIINEMKNCVVGHSDDEIYL